MPIMRPTMTEIPKIEVRSAVPADANDMARVHVTSWQETYRDVMPSHVLDDPDFLKRREHFWSAALTDARYAANRAAVAEADGEIVGIAMQDLQRTLRAASTTISTFSIYCAPITVAEPDTPC